MSGGYLKDVQCGDNGPEEEMSKTPVRYGGQGGGQVSKTLVRYGGRGGR